MVKHNGPPRVSLGGHQKKQQLARVMDMDNVALFFRLNSCAQLAGASSLASKEKEI